MYQVGKRKAASEWTFNELDIFKIIVRNQDESEFFGEDIDKIDLSDIPEGARTLLKPSIEDEESYSFLYFLNQEIGSQGHRKSSFINFDFELLKIMKYNKQGNFLRSNMVIGLLMCDDFKLSKLDTCIMDPYSIIFLIQNAQSDTDLSKLEPQIIANAIAAFQYNSRLKARGVNLDFLDEYTFPCLIMYKIYPIFYKIRVTKDLSKCIEDGLYPSFDTIVYKYNPIPKLFLYGHGMESIDDRLKIFKYLKAFKKFI